MKNRIIAFIFTVAALAAPTLAQTVQLPAPSPIEKDLAARASHVTEVTLDKNTLAFASKVMNGNDKDAVATRKLIDGLDGIYVREYEFDKEDQFSMEQIEQLRKYFETSEWSTLVRERDLKSHESTDVMVKLEKGETRGFFILEVEPKELTIVLILGPIRMEDLGKLKGISGLDALGGVEFKTKDKDKKGGDQ
ncbi:MAG TPA: DUF4252 domain-containing protein [Terracidiphilus sp.]|nr:DUF4252 domain-containing protein [Terracidiphilus sp.]